MNINIIIPAYNYVEGVKKILNEIQSDFYVIIVDNSTNEEISNLSSKYSFVSYHKIIPNGWQNNWNIGLNKTKNKFVICICHDEFIPKKSIQGIKKINLSKDVIYFFNYKVFKNKKLINKNLPNSIRKYLITYFPKFILFFNFIGPTSAYMYYNDNLNFYDKNLEWLTDVSFIYEKLKKKKIVFIPLTIESHIRESSLTSKISFKTFVYLKELIYIAKIYKFSKIKMLIYLTFSFFFKILRKLLFLLKI